MENIWIICFDHHIDLGMDVRSVRSDDESHTTIIIIQITRIHEENEPQRIKLIIQ